jgi:hypothetical protein
LDQLKNLNKNLCPDCDQRRAAGLKVNHCHACNEVRRVLADRLLDAINAG